MIVIEATTYAVVPQRVVDTEVRRISLLPTQIRIGRRHDCGIRQVGIIVEFSSSCRQIARSALIDITRSTIAQAKFQEVHPPHWFHEVLLVHVPGTADRPQRTATVFGIQSIDISIVFTEGSEDIIAVIISIGDVGIAGSVNGDAPQPPDPYHSIDKVEKQTA